MNSLIIKSVLTSERMHPHSAKRLMLTASQLLVSAECIASTYMYIRDMNSAISPDKNTKPDDSNTYST